MDQQELLGTVRTLRARRFTPAEIARAVGISKADAARLVRVVACERESQRTSAVPGNGSNHSAARQAGCWVSPGWRHGLRIDGHADWPDDAGAPSEAIDSGVACVLIAAPERPSKLSVCGYLVDTWWFGVKKVVPAQRAQAGGVASVLVAAAQRRAIEGTAEGVTEDVVIRGGEIVTPGQAVQRGSERDPADVPALGRALDAGGERAADRERRPRPVDVAPAQSKQLA